MSDFLFRRGPSELEPDSSSFFGGVAGVIVTVDGPTIDEVNFFDDGNGHDGEDVKTGLAAVDDEVLRGIAGSGAPAALDEREYCAGPILCDCTVIVAII